MNRAHPVMLLALAAAGCGGAQAHADWNAHWAGRVPPAFDLPALDGSRVSLAGLRGKVVVLHFGTSW